MKQLQRLKTWQLVILLILAGFIAATFLRLNNVGMVERRAAVIAADEAGNDDVTTQRLYDLQRYVSAHMNTDMGRGVTLKASYDRDLGDWQADAYGDQNPNGNIYKKAQEVCSPRFSSWSSAYVLCVSGELAKYPAVDTATTNNPKPAVDTYVHAFTSPLWSPDFAGWSVVVCVLLALVIVIRLIALGVLRLLLRRHYQHV